MHGPEKQGFWINQNMHDPEKGSKTKKKGKISGRRYREHEESRDIQFQKENQGL
uniref:Uncharacterized protein n=1 Tax=Solanum tuberosum TaxID=4113 RepID=M1B6U3_SOLTU